MASLKPFAVAFRKTFGEAREEAVVEWLNSGRSLAGAGEQEW